MKLEKILGIWQLTAKGRSIPINYSRLCREIEKLDPEKVGFDTVRQLEEENFLSTLPNGKRILTDLGLSKRIPLPARPVITEGTEQNWARFKRLCAYYADCVTQSEKTQEYLFESDLNTKYLLPSLPIDWLSTTEPISIDFSPSAIPAINRIKSRKEDSEDIYIGYPLSAFHDSNGKMAYSPILLFPVDSITFDRALFTLTIRYDETEINRTWLEYNVPRNDHKDVLTSICFSEGDKTGLLDAVTAVQYLANRFRIDLKPDYLDYSVEHRSKGIINSAALFVGNPLKFSKTLKKELQEIRKQPPHVLDQTALAYVFRDPPLENQYENKTSFLPFDFLEYPANHEQRVAVKQALNQPVSKVTGPPGTGKSQVAVNLIANLVFYGQSALFTSKNHKAIHAIIHRAESVSPELPLVQFCTTEDGATGAQWTTQPIDTVIAKGNVVRQQKGIREDSPLLREFEDSLENMRDYEMLFAEVVSARAKLQKIEAKYELIIPKIPVPVEQLSGEYWNNLERLANRIGEPTEHRTLLQQVLDFFLMRKIKAQNAEKELRELLTKISTSANNTGTFKKRVLRLCGDIADYLAIQDEEVTLQGQQLDIQEDELKRLAKEMAFRSEHLHEIFLAKRTSALLEIPETIQQEIKAASNRVARQNLPFLAQVLPVSSIEEAQDSFRQFSKVFPAWATTLLSLSKSSPCVAGLFDRVVIDEASQCEIPPIIPALYRARGVTVIGDPAQFPPVITMRETRHAHIRFTKHKLTDQADERFDFLHHNAFDVVSVLPLMLRNHFRCHEDIAAYFNEEYYTGKLKICTNPDHLKFPENMGFKRALVWRDIHDSLDEEIDLVKELLREMRKNNYDGKIGVISPFRKVADRLKQELYSYRSLLDVEKDVNTVNGFQGGERDLIIFVLGITSKLTKGQDWYAIAEENRYIYNVAVSRARACLIVVGDREQARQSRSSALRNLAKEIEQRPQKTLSQSPGEEMLYQALCAEGLDPKQQYPLVGRYLDMALVEEKIDIEVDGEAFHLNRYGERKQDDIYRDIQVTSVGWRVCRFWYREVRDNLEDCVDRIKKFIQETHE